MAILVPTKSRLCPLNDGISGDVSHSEKPTMSPLKDSNFSLHQDFTMSSLNCEHLSILKSYGQMV